MHEQIGAAIETLFKHSLDDHLAQIAHHYGRSGNVRKAIEYLSREAQLAARRSAVSEAFDCLEKAIELTQRLPEDSERIGNELKLRFQYGLLAGQVLGWGMDATRENYARARELAEKLGDKSQLAAAHLGLNICHLVRAQPAQAYEHANRSLELAHELNNRRLLMMVHSSVGHTFNMLAEYQRLLPHFEDAFKLYDRELDSSSSITSDFAGVLSLRAFVLWKLGYPEQAVESARDAVNLARKSGNLVSLAVPQQGLSHFYLLCRQFQLAEQTADELIRLSSENGFSYSLARGTVLGGCARTELGLHELGIRQMRDGISLLQATQDEMFLIDAMRMLGQAIGKAGDTDQGMSILDDALGRAVSSGMRDFEWEIRHEIGLLNLIRNPNSLAQAETCFRSLKATAAEWHAKSWELRATMSLARLLRDTNRRNDARAMLAEIYNWFSEGFDTPDLKDAKGLLDELSA